MTTVILIIVLGVGSAQTMTTTTMPNMDVCRSFADQVNSGADLGQLRNTAKATCMESKK